MADTVSDKDVEQARDRVEKLRGKIAQKKSDVSVAAADGANAVRLASLEREEARLQAELDLYAEAAKPATIREAVADAIAPAPTEAPDAPETQEKK